MKLFDPTSTPRERTITLAPRRSDLHGLRVGLVENTKFNSDVILAKLGERLARQHGMTVSRMIRKRSASHAVTEEAADELRRISDFVVSGVGD
jgi:endonuclease/exonuclease/phosphatase family metal-dependent hydrolase